MILNISKTKTEALLLFCKDLILAYKDGESTSLSIDEKKRDDRIKEIMNDILKQISSITKPSDYYIKNRKNYRIKAILNSYNYINQTISKIFKDGELFNPAMLCFALLAVWFQELSKEAKSKEFAYFVMYPYTLVYDDLLVNVKTKDFKLLNIKMTKIAEKVIFDFEKISIK